MTAPTTYERETPTCLFYRHIKAMRNYAFSLVPALGDDHPIVKRIRSCADSNELALDSVVIRRRDENPAAARRCECGRKLLHD